jgi:hypothetical protein
LGIDDCALYPLFSDQVIRLMHQLIPPAKHDTVAVSVVVRASAAGRPTTPRASR